MQTLIVKNQTTSPFVVQDPTGQTALSLTVLGGATVTVTVTEDQLDAVHAELDQAQTAGYITWTSDPGTSGSIVYGTGQDGVADFDGTNTFSFATKNGNTYTLTRDVYLAGGSRIRTGVTVYTSGYRGWVNGQFQNDGVLHNDGKDAVGVTAGGPSGAGTTGVGTQGGNGRTGSGAGSNGSNQQGVNTLGDAALTGGAGGQGDGTHLGGNGGTYVFSPINGGANYLTAMMTGFLFTIQSGGNSASINPIGGGAGGGGGGSNNAGVNGGGGGGGGGVLVWHAAYFINNGLVSAKGGKGADAAGAGGDGGGGGGGAAGIILSVAGARSGSGTYAVTGGAGGGKIGAGVAGSKGSDGHINLCRFP